MTMFESCFGSEQRVKWFKRRPCAIPRCNDTPSDNAHVIHSRGSGLAKPEHIIPLCRRHHAEQGNIGIETFCSKYQLNRFALASKYAAEWDKVKDQYPDGDMDF